jgi:hypothetical protein
MLLRWNYLEKISSCCELATQILSRELTTGNRQLPPPIINHPSSIVRLPPESWIVLPFENPPDVLCAVGRLAHEVPADIKELLAVCESPALRNPRRFSGALNH